MKEKLFNALKQEYSHLGLGDDVFQGQAESLANLGFVTDDNIKMVVKSQKSFLEGLQKNTEKRVTDAQKKAEEKAKKEFEEETKKKEEEAKKAAEEAEKKRIAEEEAKKAAEEAKKAEEEARLAKEAKEKAEQEEAERKRKELEAKKVPEQLIKQFEEFQAKAKEREEAYKKQAEEREAQYNAQLEEMRKASEEANKRYASWQEELKNNYTNLETNYNNMIKERDEARAIAAKKQRSEFILSKANELGIPKWRVDEGFVLAEDATEEQIAEKLSTIAQNVKTQLLPKDKHYVPSNDTKATKEEVDAIVKSMIK